MTPDLQAKYARLQAILREMGAVVIGLSGGVDSTLLVKVACDTLGEPQLEIFAGRILVRTPIRITWRDPNNPSGDNSMDFGVVEFEFRKFTQRKWLIIRYDDWRLIRMEATQMGDIPL